MLSPQCFRHVGRLVCDVPNKCRVEGERSELQIGSRTSRRVAFWPWASRPCGRRAEAQSPLAPIAAALSNTARSSSLAVSLLSPFPPPSRPAPLTFIRLLSTKPAAVVYQL